MATTVFNVGKGRFVEIYRNIKAGVRANAALVVLILQVNEAAGTLEDYLKLDTLLTAIGNTEANFTNYVRKQLVDADLPAFPGPELTGNAYEITLPDVIFSNAGGALNNTTSKCLLCYIDDSVGAVDSQIEPIIAFDYVTTTDGTNLLIEFPADAFKAT